MCEMCRREDWNNPRVVKRARMAGCNAPIIIIQGDWVCLKCERTITVHRPTVLDDERNAVYYLTDGQRDEWSDHVDMMQVMQP